MSREDFKTIKEDILKQVSETRQDINTLNDYLNLIESSMAKAETIEDIQKFVYATEEPKMIHIELF